MPTLAARLLSLWVLLLAGQAQAAEVVVHASRQGEVLHVEASAEVEGDVREVWQVLTDYDHLSDFIPGMRVSRIVARDARRLLVEQKGELRLLFFSYPIEVKLAVDEVPYERINARAVAGDFKEMTGAYRLQADRGRVRLRYSGRLTPDFLVPPLIGTFMLRRNVEKQFGALVDEIARRREAARPSTARPRS